MHNKTRQYVLSTCGTSIITNRLSQDEKKLFFRHTNAAKPSDISDPQDCRQLQSLLQRVKHELLNSSSSIAASDLSAEINSLNKLYQGQFARASGDMHCLLATDTWLGEEAAKLTQHWLKAANPSLSVEIHRHTDLQSQDLDRFQMALADLVKKLYDEIPSYRHSGYHVVFNLTGGFKGVQGFLQSVANFYADKTVYIFESAPALMEIPRLPVRLDFAQTVNENLTSFRNLAANIHSFEDQEPLNQLPETLLFRCDDEVSLSAWGEVVWHEAKQVLYKQALHPSPRPQKIQYAPTFAPSVKGIEAHRLLMVNQKIDALNEYIESNKALDSLDFKQLKGPAVKGSTHEMDAWSDGDAKRIFGHFEGSCFVIDRLDHALH